VLQLFLTLSMNISADDYFKNKGSGVHVTH
jgi:hypothetical protein